MTLLRRCRVIKVLFLLLILSAVPVRAQVNVTGLWTGSSIAGGASYPNSFALVQNGTTVLGSATNGTAPGTITGTVSGNVLVIRSEYPAINYSSDAQAVVEGDFMSGTFLDSQGTSGTFTAQRSTPVLTPNLTLQNPPITEVKGKNVRVTLQRFSVTALLTLRSTPRRGIPKTTAQYEVRIAGAERRKIISKRNALTVKKLKPGSYTVSYRVSAIRSGKRLFSTKFSPNAQFTVRGG